MDLFTVLVVLVVVGIALYCINKFIPMEATVKKILNIAVIIGVVLWLLKVSGILAELKSIHF